MAATPQALDTHFYHASFLRDHGRLHDAIDEFAYVLSRAPDHVETQLALGVVLARVGRRLEARAAFERAVGLEPGHCGALVNLANALALDDAERAHALYAAALARDAAFVPAHRGLCSLAAARGDAAAAAGHRRAGYGGGPFARRPYVGESVPPSVLALVSTDGGNIGLEKLLDERRFLVHELYVEAYRDEPLPPHALIVNAIADADRSAPALARAAGLVRAARVPVVNAPAAVATTGRVSNAVRLGRISGVIAPAARRIDRDAPPPGTFPLVLRVAGFHMGRGMTRVDDAGAFTNAIRSLPARADAIAIDYVETRSPDGAWRKFRVMSIDGIVFPLHLAVAHRWDVHYFSATMTERADYRAEEARFLETPRGVLGQRAWDALARVSEALGLDYAGIDFALAADGRIVVFEANAAMTVLQPDPDERFAYRRGAADAVHEALVRMFQRRIA